MAHLGLLRLGRHDEQLGGGMYDLDLADDSRGIGCDKESSEVVDDQLVPSFETFSSHPERHGSVHAPFGPKLVRTRSDNSDTA